MKEGDPKIYEVAQRKLDTYLRTHGKNPSRVRNMVLQQVCQMPSLFTAAELLEACMAERISQGTVYNSLNTFVDAMIVHVTRRQQGKPAMEYELIAGTSTKMRYICQKCGRAVEIRDKRLSSMIAERNYVNFKPEHFTLFVYGECKVCRRNARKEKV